METNFNHWFVGGIDVETNDLFYEKVSKRDAEKLTNVILRHVEIGSIIFTDSWRVYNAIDGLYQHYTVDHSRQFKNGVVNTQKIEATVPQSYSRLSPQRKVM